MKRSELTNKQKLSVTCPVCAAAMGENCKMYSGRGQRNEPHAERKYQAVQVIDRSYDQHKSSPVAVDRLSAFSAP